MLYRSVFSVRRGLSARHLSASTGWFWLERLEPRRLFSGNGYYPIDGEGVNPAQPNWGTTGVDLLRQGPADYSDGISAPAGANRPSARAISNAVDAATSDLPNDRFMSAYSYAWGQFIDHDLDLTSAASPAEPFNIPVPAGDPSFDPNGTGTQTIALNRSEYDPNTGTSTSNPRQQVNEITAWLDGSVVYGSDPTRAAALRTFQNGLLKTSRGNLMPFNRNGLPNANDAHLVPDNQLFLGGDVRANENVELTAIDTLFVREHNRIATQLDQQHPWWNDEQLYQAARRIVIAEIQSITYNEFLPSLLGDGAITPYQGFDPTVNPGISTEFSTAAYRVGHSLLDNEVEFLDDNGNEVRDPLPLANAFFNPPVVQQTGIDPILKYLASDNAQEVDPQLVDGVRNLLFGPPGSGGSDLAALDIQRGRDHGLADYNTTRVAFGLPAVTRFGQITSDPAVRQQLRQLYGSVDNIDVFVGGLAEDHVRGSSVGPLFRAIIADQFTRIRDGDPLWFENTLHGAQLDAIENTTLADVIERNTNLNNLQSDVFFFNVTIQGRVFNDVDGNGSFNRSIDQPLPGWTVKLEDASGNVLQTTTTASDGTYQFTGLSLGTYLVREVTLPGWKRDTPNPPAIQVAEGQTISGIRFGNVPVSSAPTSPALDSSGTVDSSLSSTEPLSPLLS